MKNCTRQEKIQFLLNGEKELGINKGFNAFMYSENYNLDIIPDKLLDELVEELDWIWK